MEHLQNIPRRDFFKLTGVASTGLVLGVNSLSTELLGQTVSSFNPSVFIHIPTSGPIELVNHRSEMGQGTRTGIIQLIADELDVDMKQIKIIQATGDKKYGDQNTDGSRSIKFNWDRLREMGALAKELSLIHI